MDKVCRWFLQTFAAFCFIAAMTVQAVELNGQVFDDRNRNGSLDSDETGIPGVAISNGLTVVLTDSDGRYAIDVADGETLFITKPEGYLPALDEFNLPRFYFTLKLSPPRQDLGYPDLEPQRIPAGGKLDFSMYPQDESAPFTVLWTSDPQPRNGEELTFVRDDVVLELMGTDAAFGLTTGDIMFDDLSLMPRYRALFARVGIPWFNVPGNHDMNFKAEDDAVSLQTYRRYLGPTYYSFNWGKTHFVILDSIYFKGTGPPQPNGTRPYEGRVDTRQLQWLRADLQHVPKDRLVVLVTHIPFKIQGQNDTNFSIQNRAEVFALLEGFEHVFAVAGHLHRTQHVYIGREDGYQGKTPLHQHILATIAGNWWSGDKDERGIPYTLQADGTPNGYHLMQVDGTDYRVSYRAAGKAGTYQMRLMLELQPDGVLVSTVTTRQLQQARFLVNLFDGGDNSRLTFRLNDGPPRDMLRETRGDPFAFASYLNREVFNSGIETPSTHLWTATLPQDLRPGAYTITVDAVDEFGGEHRGYGILEVLEPE